MANKIYHTDFTEAVQPKKFHEILNLSDELPWGKQKFLRRMEKEVAMEDGHYQLPLPFRKRDQDWPNYSVKAKMKL